MDIVIKKARIIDSTQDFIGDIYIKDGEIYEIGRDINRNCRVIDAEGLALMPSFIDIHSHFRDPGFTQKEDILTGCKAAVKGGYTTVNLMANTNPVCSSMDIVDYVTNKAKEIGLLNVYQAVSITENFDGETVSHISNIKDGVVFISDDGKGVQKSKIMLEAMIEAKNKGLIVMSHAENNEFNNVDTRLSENMMTIRDIALAKYTKCSLHMAHVSTKEAMDEVIKAKNSGYKNITCEVTPHHIALTESTKYTVNPELRTREDVDFLISAIKNGYVDCISTDHAPHTKSDKQEGKPGISGIETSFAVSYTTLVIGGNIGISELSKLMSKNPATIMKLNKGEIKIGYDGDIVLIDLNKRYKIDSSKFESKGKNTPFNNKEVFGEIKATLKSGEIVYCKEDFKC